MGTEQRPRALDAQHIYLPPLAIQLRRRGSARAPRTPLRLPAARTLHTGWRGLKRAGRRLYLRRCCSQRRRSACLCRAGVCVLGVLIFSRCCALPAAHHWRQLACLRRWHSFTAAHAADLRDASFWPWRSGRQLAARTAPHLRRTKNTLLPRQGGRGTPCLGGRRQRTSLASCLTSMLP